MKPSGTKRLKVDFGPCPGCLSGMVDLLERQMVDCALSFLPWLPPKRDHCVECGQCGFSMDVESYRKLQSSCTAWGVEVLSKKFVVGRDTDCHSEATETTSRDDRHQSETEEEKGCAVNSYVSLAQLIAEQEEGCDNDVRCCRCCDKSLDEDWRFCPQCGMFVDSLASRNTSSENLTEDEFT